MGKQLTLAIPNFNGGRYLEETLLSLERNRPYIRWWLQDCCSTDLSTTIAAKYKTDSDTVSVQKDSGQTDGLNRAFKAMGGDIIGYINSDDLLCTGAAEAILETFDRHPDVDLVYGEVEWIDSTGAVNGHHRGDISTLTDLLDIYNVWWRGRQWVQPEVFWRRTLWERIGEFSLNYELAFDYHYWVRCFLGGVRVKRIPRVLACFRKHPEQKSIRAFDAACEIRNVAAEAIEGGALIPLWQRLRIRAALEYDRYHAGQDHTGRSFLSVLSSHPHWLIAPSVRKRLYGSL